MIGIIRVLRRHSIYSMATINRPSDIQIPKEKLDIKSVRSSGPGGQHVNTTNSKVELRFNVWSADWLDKEVKKRLVEEYG